MYFEAEPPGAFAEGGGAEVSGKLNGKPATLTRNPAAIEMAREDQSLYI